MKFENLANELLLELFEYLPIMDLFHVFYGLNRRFNTLLNVNFRAFHLDCRSMRKHDFDVICQKYLPNISDRIRSIRLSDDNETPLQIHSFETYQIAPSRFHSLQSLAICHLRSSSTMNTLLIQCHHLISLSHLDFIDCSFRNDHESIIKNLNNLWSLPQLRRCHIDIDLNVWFKVYPSTICTTLQHLSIESYTYESHEIFNLWQHSPALRYLSVLTADSILIPLFSFSSLIKLNLSVYESSSTMINLLHSVPNLRHLIVATDQVNLTGDQWEQLIVKHLPKLCVLRLKMIFRLDDNQDIEIRANELLDSFRSSFWLKERRWFVRCNWNLCNECAKNNIYLYTLPYGFNSYFLHDPHCQSKSTNLRDDDCSSYRDVRHLAFTCDPFDIRLPSFFSFSDLTHLDIDLPVDHENLYSSIQRFDRLTHLRITKFQQDHPLFDPLQLQNLLEHMIHLYSIQFDSWISSSDEMPPYDFHNRSVHRLNLQNVNQYYNTGQCRRLFRSPLGGQCEMLTITVESRSIILDLVNNMRQLRALDIICRDDSWTPNDVVQESSFQDELVEWLQIRLPVACTISRASRRIFDDEFKQWTSILIWL